MDSVDPSEGDDEFILPASHDPRAAWAAKRGSPVQRSVPGSLMFDGVEGGCSYLQADDGARYEVIYPDGWTLDRMAAELRGPDGRLVRAGDPMIVRGTIATGRSSICQVGPILLATVVDIPAG